MSLQIRCRLATLAKPLAAAAIATLAWLPAQGFAQDESLRFYRCYQGDNTQCAATRDDAEVRIEKRVVPGPYARYLMHIGDSFASATAKAQAIGEQTIERTVRITKQHLTGGEKYARWNGALSRLDTIEETLAEATIDAQDQRIASMR